MALKSLLSRWKERKLPIDPLFSVRHKIDWLHYKIVELGATEHTILLDSLHAIQSSDEDISVKSSQVLGLRLQALAYSLRTPSGRIPLDPNSEADLSKLALYPIALTAKAVKSVSELSDIPWLSPDAFNDEVRGESAQESASENHDPNH